MGIKIVMDCEGEGQGWELSGKGFQTTISEFLTFIQYPFQ